MFHLDYITNENNKEHFKKWPFIPDHPYRILTIHGSGSLQTKALLNFIKEQDDIGKIYLYAKDLIKPKYAFLTEKREDAGIKHFNDLRAFIESSNTMDNVYENTDEYKPKRKRKTLTVFDDMMQTLWRIKISSYNQRTIY